MSAILAVRCVDFDQLRVVRGPHVAGELNPVFIVQGDNGGDQVRTRLAAFASFSMAIAARRVVRLEAAVYRFGGVDLESSRPAAPSPPCSGTAARGNTRGRGHRLLRLQYDHDAKEGETAY